MVSIFPLPLRWGLSPESSAVVIFKAPQQVSMENFRWLKRRNLVEISYSDRREIHLLKNPLRVIYLLDGSRH
jgi:hypothetical protein